MKTFEEIIKTLPYGEGFLFVDKIESIDENTIVGYYKYTSDLFFYHSHFQDNPLVPGVILIETMGQIGMVCHLIYLTNEFSPLSLPVLSNVQAEFFGKVDYNETIKVIGRKKYFRKNILKSYVEMRTLDNMLVATLTASICIIAKKDE